MREIQADVFRSHEMNSVTENGASAYNLVSLQDNSTFESDLQKTSAGLLLPSIELAENTSKLTPQRTSSDASHVRDRFGLNPEQRQIAEGIEKSILSGDLNTLQSTMSQFAHRGQDLGRILTKVRFDMMVQREIDVHFTSNRPGDQCLVRISKDENSVSVSTDHREPPASTGSNATVGDDFNEAQRALKKIGRYSETNILQTSENGVESGRSVYLQKSNLMSEWAAKNFSSLDLDSNGYIDFAEIDRLSHRSTVDDDPKWFENLDSLKKTYEVLQKSSNDQWFWEDGISHADLKSHSKAAK